MIIQEIKLIKYDWSIVVYYAVDAYYSDEILKELDKLKDDDEEDE